MKKSKQNYNFLKIHLQLKKYANFIHYFNLNYLRKEWWDTDGLNNLYYKLRESNLLREKKKMQNVTTLKVWFSRRRERIGKKVRNLLSAKGREIWMDVLRKTKHRPNEMVIGVETKLKKKKKRVGRGGGREQDLDGRAASLRRTYPEETFSAADAIVRHDAAGDHLSMRIITARLYAPAHTTVFTPLPSHAHTEPRIYAYAQDTCTRVRCL